MAARLHPAQGPIAPPVRGRVDPGYQEYDRVQSIALSALVSFASLIIFPWPIAVGVFIVLIAGNCCGCCDDEGVDQVRLDPPQRNNFGIQIADAVQGAANTAYYLRQSYPNLQQRARRERVDDQVPRLPPLPQHQNIRLVDAPSPGVREAVDPQTQQLRRAATRAAVDDQMRSNRQSPVPQPQNARLVAASNPSNREAVDPQTQQLRRAAARVAVDDQMPSNRQAPLLQSQNVRLVAASNPSNREATNAQTQQRRKAAAPGGPPFLNQRERVG